ncbi:MAG TPA: hypothetical protein VLT51_05430 [Anaerolineales bacterium]|nr:hypothetical protein [Anaerolineales bacterium]
MSETPANPVFVALLFILRCLVPVAVLFGISYLLRRLGLVAETPEPPSGYEENGNSLPEPENNDEEKEGDLTHDNA